MVFNSVAFLVFIACFFPIYFLLKGNARLVFILAGSYTFYGWWDYRFLVLIALSTCIDFYLSIVIDNQHDPRRRKLMLGLSIFINLAILGFFKYFNFFVDSANDLLGLTGNNLGITPMHIILPVGISFYTFQSMSYTIDVYRKQITPEPGLLKFATFIAFFPQLVAGPIVRAVDFIPQLYKSQQVQLVEFSDGIGAGSGGVRQKDCYCRFAGPVCRWCVCLSG